MANRTDAGETNERKRLKQKIWNRHMWPLPTTLRRLIYLALLRDDNTGHYHSLEVARLGSEGIADLILREIHGDVFETWLSLPLEQQHDELTEYLGALTRERASDLEAWLTLAPYGRLIPTQAEAAESELFRSDLRILLELLNEGREQRNASEDRKRLILRVT